MLFFPFSYDILAVVLLKEPPRTKSVVPLKIPLLMKLVLSRKGDIL